VLEILYVWLLRTQKKYKKRMCQDNITRSWVEIKFLPFGQLKNYY
jgi:hypothetical protein